MRRAAVVSLVFITACGTSPATLDGGRDGALTIDGAASDGPHSDSAAIDGATADAGSCSCSGSGLTIHAVFSQECILTFGCCEIIVKINGVAYYVPNDFACAVPGPHENWFEVPWPASIQDGDPVAISYDGASDKSVAYGVTTVTASTATCQLVELPVVCNTLADAGVPDAF